MKLQIKSNPWECLLVASAMAMGLPANQLRELLGHDGSNIVDEGVPEPAGRRGFHEQEIIHVALDLGWAVTSYERCPVAAYPNNIVELGDRSETFNMLVDKCSGVLLGSGQKTGHAMAFHEGWVFDPDGIHYAYAPEACEARGFHPKELLIYDKVN